MEGTTRPESEQAITDADGLVHLTENRMTTLCDQPVSAFQGDDGNRLPKITCPICAGATS